MSCEVIIEFPDRLDVFHFERGKEMGEFSDNGMAGKEIPGIPDCFFTVIFPVTVDERLNPPFFLPVIFPADAMEKEEEIDGFLLFPVFGVKSAFPVKESEFSVFVCNIPESRAAVDDAVCMEGSQSGACFFSVWRVSLLLECQSPACSSAWDRRLR